MATEETVPFGDVLEKVTVSLFLELELTIENMKGQDPELRTQILRRYLFKARKSMFQVLSIAKWYISNNEKRIFTNINEFKNQLQYINDMLASSQDSLFFIHRDIFPKRSRPYETSLATDIITNTTYRLLPDVMIESGYKKPAELISKDIVINNLNLYIRSKIYMNEDVPSEIVGFYNINNGIITININNLYELQLSLTQFSENADWMVLSAHILVKNHSDEFFFATYDSISIDRDLLTILRQHSTISKDITSLEQDDLNTNNNQSIQTLSKYHHICKQTATAVALRLLYIQALDLSRTTWKNHIQVDFNDLSEITILKIKFWKGQITNSYQFELRVIQSRGSLKVNNNIYLELWTINASEHDMQQCNDMFNKEIDINSYFKSGVTFTKLLNDTINYCCEHRLDIIYRRLLKTKCVNNAIESGYIIKYEDNSIIIKLSTLLSFDLRIYVERQTGRLLVIYSNKSPGINRCDKVIDLFSKEINNLDIEILTKQSLMLSDSSLMDIADDFDNRSTKCSEDVESMSIYSAKTMRLVLKSLSTMNSLLNCFILLYISSLLPNHSYCNNNTIDYLINKLKLSKEDLFIGVEIHTFKNIDSYLKDNDAICSLVWMIVLQDNKIYSYLVLIQKLDSLSILKSYQLNNILELNQNLYDVSCYINSSLDDITSNYARYLNLNTFADPQVINLSSYQVDIVNNHISNDVNYHNVSVSYVIGKFIIVDLLYSQTNSVLTSNEIMSVDIYNQLTSSNYDDNIVGKAILSIHSTSASNSYYILCDDFIVNDESISSLADVGKQLIINYLRGDSNILDDDDDSNKQVIKKDIEYYIFDLNEIKEKIDNTISKIISLYCFIFLLSIYKPQKSDYRLRFLYVFKDPSIPKIMVSLDKISSSSKYLSLNLFVITTEFELIKKRTKTKSLGQILAPTSKVRISDINNNGFQEFIDVNSLYSNNILIDQLIDRIIIFYKHNDSN